MPQLLLLGLVAAGSWYAWKALKREMTRIDDELERERKAEKRPDATLERDPATGKYRLRQGKVDGKP